MALMAECSRKRLSHDFHRVSRKAEEAALRRYQAVHWLECVLGPLGMPSELTERDFISCLRNGIILCNVINKIQPGAILKVVENNVPGESVSMIWDSKPLPAYQYFENVRNFLIAVEKLKLPAFEASDLERENFEAGSAARIADCILALKSYHEWKEWSGGNGVYKHVTVKSPLVLHSAAKSFSRPQNSEASRPCRRLDMSAMGHKQSLADSIVKALAEHMIDSKENMNSSYLESLQNASQDPVHIFSELLSRCLEEKLTNKFPTLNMQDPSRKSTESFHRPTSSILKENSSVDDNSKCHGALSRKDNSDRCLILQTQENELKGIRALWLETKKEFEDLQRQLLTNLNSLGSLVEEMSSPACGYQKVVQENRKLYNMVQDLKGNIRVYCRIRPMLNAAGKNIISYQGEDGTLVVLDPSKSQTDGKKAFQFNRVYGPVATQDDVFKDAQPLIRSVLDGYNVCILAYGQAGSGKTYTMHGPSGSSNKEMGIYFFALNDLFQTVTTRKDIISFELHVQMVEICHEQMRDLLPDISEFQDALPEVTSHSVKSSTDAITLVKQGEMRRTGVTSSSFSHSVVTVHVQGKDLSGNTLCSRLHLVDLAGSGQDDKSLSCLEEVITSLSQKCSDIHFRDSKLTSHLQHALGGKAKILVFAHVSPEGDNFTKTASTLKFAQRISTIELGAAQSNKMNREVMELKNEIETLKTALGDYVPSSLQPNKRLNSPCDKQKVLPQRTPVKTRRLSMEIPGTLKTEKLPKSPIGKSTAEITPQHSLKTVVGDPTAVKTDVRDAGTGRQRDIRSPEKPLVEGLFPRSRMLSIENPSSDRADRGTKLKEPKSPCEGKTKATKQTPPRTRRLSIENPNFVKPYTDIRKSVKTPQTSLLVRRQSLEGPKDGLKEPLKTANVTVSSIVDLRVPKSPTTCYANEPIFTDCAAQFPSMQPPKTPERQTRNEYKGVNIVTDSQTPAITKSTNGKGSQIKKSLRTIKKLIHGSEKRNQHKLESTLAKSKYITDEAKSPPSSKAKVLRRQSLTSIAPPETRRRSSLGGMSTDDVNRSAKTPPSERSSTITVKRWM